MGIFRLFLDWNYRSQNSDGQKFFHKLKLKRCLLLTERTLPSCEKVTKPACLSDNLNGLGNKTRTRLQSLLNNLGPVLNSNCSFNLKRLACFIETSPCVTNNGHTLYTCQSLCQEVWSSCDGEFQRHNIFFPKCIPNFSEVSSGDGLCQQLQWPVPWPNSGWY